MRTMAYFTGEELRKLFRSGKLKVLLALSFAIGALFAVAGGYAGLDGNLSSIALELLLAVVLPLFMAALGSELMVGEFKDGTIKNVLRLPLSREFLYFGKLFAGWIAAACVVLAVFVPTFLGSLLLEGMPAWSSVGTNVGEAAAAVLFCGLLLVLANAVSLWTGSAGTGLVVGVVLWIGMSVLGFLEPALGRFLVTSYADWAQPLLRGGGAGASISTLLFIIAYYMIGSILGLIAFQRKET